MRLRILTCCLAVLLLTGCGISTETPAAPEAAAPAAPDAPDAPKQAPGDVMAQWNTFAAGGGAALQDQARAEELGRALAASGAAAMTPLLDVIAENPGDPLRKVCAVMTLTPVIMKDHEPRLLEMTAAGQDRVTRANAAHLLATLAVRNQAGPETQARLRELYDDADAYVAHAAVLRMLTAGDPEAVQRAVALWAVPETTLPERAQIVGGIPQALWVMHLPLFMEAAANADLPLPARQRAVQVLADAGDASVLDTLRKIAEADPDPDLKKAAQEGADMVQKRVDEGIVVAPLGAGPITVPPAPAQAAPAGKRVGFE
ncbi:MAG TPA: hypothetical protein PKL54_02580 [Candidatus Hydrogenedentes bacterium]|nr:hypothetical protein [Candidatus Hydrogenedentota bacterium]